MGSANILATFLYKAGNTEAVRKCNDLLNKIKEAEIAYKNVICEAESFIKDERPSVFSNKAK